MQEERAIRLLGAGTLSILVIIACLVLAIMTRPKPVSSAKPISFNATTSTQVVQPTIQSQPQGQVVAAETTTPAEKSVTSQKYTVQAGDTLYGIALQFKVNWKDIAKANNIADTGSLHEGQEIIIP